MKIRDSGVNIPHELNKFRKQKKKKALGGSTNQYESRRPYLDKKKQTLLLLLAGRLPLVIRNSIIRREMQQRYISEIAPARAPATPAPAAFRTICFVYSLIISFFSIQSKFLINFIEIQSKFQSIQSKFQINSIANEFNQNSIKISINSINSIKISN